MDHREVTRREFTRQVGEFERPDSFFAQQDPLDWIAAHVPVGPDDVLLDVAGGAGHVARHLVTRFAIVVDLTRRMLAAGVAAGDPRLVFVEGDATELPFADGQFDVVVSRFAFHHIDDVARAASEMARVAKPGGTVAVIDMVDGGARHNELERLRDPSHTRALPESELLSVLVSAGVDASIASDRVQRIPAEPWLERAASVDAPRSEILSVLAAEADGGASTGLRASHGSRGLVVEQRWVIAVGVVSG
jgi:SAM-dependent methyltransferase